MTEPSARPPRWKRAANTLTRQFRKTPPPESAEPSAGDHPRCDTCSLPAVCLGADLAYPKRRCPHCCRADPQFGGLHGDNDYLQGHAAAEGVQLARIPDDAAKPVEAPDTTENPY